MVHTQGGSVLYVCTKFEADSSFRSKLLGVPNFAPPQTPFLMARDAQNLISWRLSLPKSYKEGPTIRKLGHAQLGVGLWCLRREAQFFMSVPNLKWISSFRPKVIMGSQN